MASEGGFPMTLRQTLQGHWKEKPAEVDLTPQGPGNALWVCFRPKEPSIALNQELLLTKTARRGDYILGLLRLAVF